MVVGPKPSSFEEHFSYDLQSIGQRMAYLRKKEKVTQQQLAEALSLSNNYISALETGRSVFRLDVLLEYLHFLGYSDLMIAFVLDPETSTELTLKSRHSLQTQHDLQVAKELIAIPALNA